MSARTERGRTLLDDVSFAVQRGWLVAVVGPTGAGKTSLARALTGALALRSGQIRLDGADLAEDPDRRRRIGYVPQDNVLHGSLGLARTVAYAAGLRAPRGADRKVRRGQVTAALAELGLDQHSDVPVNDLSGGQRKRANIAAELVGGPDVIVLDEPTSGLDPGYEKSVLTNLRALADSGRTVITITHSVAAIAQSDRVLYLAAGGRVAYFGTPQGASRYFGANDTADVFLALDNEQTDEATDWKTQFRSHPAYSRYVRPILDRASGSDASPAAPLSAGVRWPIQFVTLVRRQIDLIRADRRHAALLLLQGPILGLLVRFVVTPSSLRETAADAVATGGSPQDAARTIATLVALSATWLGVSGSIREIVKERHIVQREVGAGLSPSAFVASKALVLGAITALQAAVLTAIACYGHDLPVHGAVLGNGRLELMAVGAAVGVAATALGLLLSSLATSPDKALALLPVALVAQLALAGSWATDLTSAPLVVVRSLFSAHWGIEAFTASVWDDPGQWTSASVSLALLTAATVLATVAMVTHHTRPAVVRPGLGSNVWHAVQSPNVRGPIGFGGIAACCILAAVGGVIHITGDRAGAPVELVAPVTAPVVDLPTTDAPAADVAQAPPTPVDNEAVRAISQPAPTTTTTTTVAPATTTAAAPEPPPAPTTTTTFYTPPATPTPAVTGGDVQATAATPVESWFAAWTRWMTSMYGFAWWGAG